MTGIRFDHTITIKTEGLWNLLLPNSAMQRWHSGLDARLEDKPSVNWVIAHIRTPWDQEKISQVCRLINKAIKKHAKAVLVFMVSNVMTLKEL